MGKKRKRPPDPYRQVRKPVPPPGRVIPDRRRRLDEERAEREAEDEKDER